MLDPQKPFKPTLFTDRIYRAEAAWRLRTGRRTRRRSSCGPWRDMARARRSRNTSRQWPTGWGVLMFLGGFCWCLLGWGVFFWDVFSLMAGVSCSIAGWVSCFEIMNSWLEHTWLMIDSGVLRADFSGGVLHRQGHMVFGCSFLEPEWQLVLTRWPRAPGWILVVLEVSSKRKCLWCFTTVSPGVASTAWSSGWKQLTSLGVLFEELVRDKGRRVHELSYEALTHMLWVRDLRRAAKGRSWNPDEKQK